jgi:serine/threonine protein kinase
MKSKEQKYIKTTKLGEGTYGIVFRAKDQKGQEIYALKKIRLQADQEGIPSTAIREISLLKELNHINIVKLYEVMHSIKKLTLVFEYVEQDLKKVIDSTKGKGLEMKYIKSYLYQLLKGIDFIHKHKVLHRDLKPQNLLITNDLKLKLCDFGLSRMFSLPMGKMTHEIITLWYRPPEVLLGIENYTTKVDSWSIGCIMAEMISGKPLFPGDSEIGQLFKIFEFLGTPNEETWPGVSKLPEYKITFPQWKPQSIRKKFKGFDEDGLDLMEKFLQMDPEKRITIREALNHPFIVKFKEEAEGDNTDAND